MSKNPWSSAPCLYVNTENGKKCYESVGYERSYCKKHQQPAWSRPWLPSPTPKFRQNRNLVISRAKGFCQNQKPGFEKCGKIGVEVDHIIPRAEGGSDNLANLQLLCVDCHKEKTLEDQKRALRENRPKRR